MGYVLVKGKALEKVADTTTIYASPACHRVIRRGKNDQKGPHEAVNSDEIKKAIEHEVNTANPDLPSGIGGAVNKIGGSVLDFDSTKVNAITESSAKSEISKAIAGKEGGYTQSPIVDEITQMEAYSKTKLEEFNAATEKLKGVSFPVTAVNSMSQWFDDMEAVIDALPTMSKDGGLVYEVEKSEEGYWYYTGESQPMDREWNMKLQDAKASVCLWLQGQMDKVTQKLEVLIQDQLAKMDNCGPFMRAIQIIQQIPSLTTIIKWATSVIDFLVAFYKLIYNYYKMTIQMLEIIIIRFPQLINKFMQKITEYNCNINYNVSINVKKK